MKIVVTGAHGFVGSQLVDFLLKDGFEVYGIDCDGSGKRNILWEQLGYKFFQIDISQPFTIDCKADFMIHTAAFISQKEQAMAKLVITNINGTKNCIDYALKAGIKKIVNFSSISVFGEVKSDIVNEQTDCTNVNTYGLSKLVGELLLKEVEDTVSSVNMRLPGIIGVGAQGPWISRVVTSALNNEPIIFSNENALFNNLIHVSDIYVFIKKIINLNICGYDVVTLAAEEPIRLGEVVQYILDKTDSSSPVSIKETTRKAFRISTDKVKNKYNFFARSVMAMLDSYIEETSILFRDKKNMT